MCRGGCGLLFVGVRGGGWEEGEGEDGGGERWEMGEWRVEAENCVLYGGC